MLDPRSATRGACARSSSTMASASSIATGPEAALGLAVAARVVGERRHPVGPAAASEVEVALLGRSRRRAGPRRPRPARPPAGTARRPGRRGRRARAVWAWGGASLLHNRRSTMSALAVSHVYPLGSRLNERGRLEVGGCDVVELAAEFGTPAYVYAEDDMRARARTFVEAFRARTRALRGDLRQQGVPLHRGLPAVRRGGAVRRRGVGRRASPRARGRDGPEAALHAREQQVAGRARLRDRERHRPHRGRLVRRDRAPARPLAAGDAAGHAGHRAEHALVHPDRPGGLEVRLPDGRGAARGARRARTAGLELRGLHAHIGSQILDVDVFEKLGELLAGDGRLAAAEPRRRARHRLHGRGPPAVDRGVRRRAACGTRPRA